MSAIPIVLLLLVGVVLVASFVLGRATHEVENVGDDEYVELEDSWVRYSVLGGGPPVVLVHGWLSSSRVWEGLADRLAQRFTVYTLDLTGFGESDKPLSGYGVRNGSRLLYSFCAHFGLTRANVIAHDLGGDMAVKLAADHPDVVGRLVLVCTPADEDQIDLPTALWLATLPVIGPLFYALGRAARPVRRLWMRPFVLDSGDLTEEVIEDSGRSTPAAVAKTLSVGRREISGGRLARQARIVKIPTLLVAGEDDQIVDPRAVGAWADSIERSETCLVDGCGHLPMVERAAEFNARVLAFLTGDARYLEYAAGTGRPEPPEAANRTAGALPDEETDAAPYGGIPRAGTHAGPADDDTADLSPGDEAGPPNRTSGWPEGTPNVRRKPGAAYPARGRKLGPSPEVSSNGTENGAGGRGGSRHPRGASEGDVIPEPPENLFERTDPRYREDPSPNAFEDDDGYDGPQEPPSGPRRL